jgi:hypothetical protein
MYLDASAAIVISDWVWVSRVILQVTTVTMCDWSQNNAPYSVVLIVASCTGTS